MLHPQPTFSHSTGQEKSQSNKKTTTTQVLTCSLETVGQIMTFSLLFDQAIKNRSRKERGNCYHW